MPRPRPIPPDPEGMNDRRAEWAWIALSEFISITGADREDALADLLCDLRHWCDRHATSFATESERALRMYREETAPLPTAQDLGANPGPAPTTPVPFRDIPNQPDPENDVPF